MRELVITVQGHAISVRDTDGNRLFERSGASFPPHSDEPYKLVLPAMNALIAAVNSALE